MEIKLSALRGMPVSAPDAPQCRLRDVHLDSMYWVVRDLVLDMPGAERPRIVSAGLLEQRRAAPPYLRLRAAATALPRAWHADRRSAVGMLGYTVEALDVPVGRIADMTLDDATWRVRAISVRMPSGGVLTVPVLTVAALLAGERRMVLRLDRKKLLRFRYPRAVEAEL